MTNIWKIIVYTKKFWKFYLFLGFFVVLTSILSLVGPLLLKQIVDLIVAKISGKTIDLQQVFIFLGLIIATDIFTTTFTAISTWVSDILAVRLQTFLSKNFYEHLLALDISFYDNTPTGEIANKLTRGITSITNFINNAINNFLPFFLTAIVTIVLLAHYSLVIALLLAVLFPIYILISHKSTLSWNAYEDKKNAIHDVAIGRIFESFSGIRIVKAFAAEIMEIKNFLESRGQVENLNIAQTKKWHIYDFFRRFVLNIILFAIISYIIYWTFLGKFTIGEMTLLMQLVQQARFPLFAMSFILGQIQMANSGSKDFFELLNRVEKIKDDIDAKKLKITNYNNKAFIEFKNVIFAYEKGRQVLSGISFQIQKGKKLALVGESGQGKSTIVNLLLRFYEPRTGTIKISGQDISAVTQKSLHEQVAVVFQDAWLFSGTILENIKYGSPDATFDQVKEAARAANAHNFIEELPGKYEVVVGERGVKLSGGQKQRISIARAILKNAPLIVMDEATSSLDSRSEIEVQIGLERLMKNRTTIIIAHRLSTIADADNILVIAQGKIAQYGSPQVLLKDKKGLYAQMIHLQESLLSATPEEKAAALQKFDLVA